MGRCGVSEPSVRSCGDIGKHGPVDLRRVGGITVEEDEVADPPGPRPIALRCSRHR